MADVFEQNLPSKANLTTSDYIRVVGSDNVSYKQLVSDVASKIVEDYAGSTLAGTAQSIKGAIDTLNEKLTITSPTAPTLTQTGGTSNALITSYKAYGKMRFLTLKVTLTDAVNTGVNAFVGTISDTPSAGASGVSYWGSSGFILVVSTSGAVTIRVIGANAVSGAEPSINITYCVA